MFGRGIVGLHRIRIGRKTLAFTAVSGLALSFATVGTANADNITPGNCTNLVIPVSLTNSPPADQTVSATYCTPKKWRPFTAHQVDVLTAGATYNRWYWDAPSINGYQYSFVDEALASGVATLNYDRVGTGA